MNNPDEDRRNFEHPPCNTKLFLLWLKVVCLCLSLVNYFILDLFICFFVSACRHVLRRQESWIRLRTPPGNFSLPTHNFHFIIYRPVFLWSLYLYRCLLAALPLYFFLPFFMSGHHFYILLQSSSSSSPLCPGLNAQWETSVVSPAYPPFPSPSSHRFHCSCRFLPPSADSAHPLSSVFPWLCLPGLSPADPYSRCSRRYRSREQA